MFLKGPDGEVDEEVVVPINIRGPITHDLLASSDLLFHRGLQLVKLTCIGQLDNLGLDGDRTKTASCS